jgi:hypothetical protein
VEDGVQGGRQGRRSGDAEGPDAAATGQWCCRCRCRRAAVLPLLQGNSLPSGPPPRVRPRARPGRRTASRWRRKALEWVTASGAGGGCTGGGGAISSDARFRRAAMAEGATGRTLAASKPPAPSGAAPAADAA